MSSFSVNILTKYENNNGSTDNCLNQSKEVLEQRIVDHVDIAMDQVQPHHYKPEEDPLKFQSSKTSRGPLTEGWRDDTQPIMCSYKLVDVRFELMSLLQARIEEFVHKVNISTNQLSLNFVNLKFYNIVNVVDINVLSANLRLIRHSRHLSYIYYRATT